MHSSAEVSLDAIEQAYGRNADLYEDVLKVSHTASPESIQKAFFERRQELLHIISKGTGDGSRAEQQMDAVVMAFRILGDPEQRMDYDELRWQRLHTRDRRGGVHSPATISTEPTRTVTPEKKKKKKSKHSEELTLHRAPSDEHGALSPPSTPTRNKKNRSSRFSMRDDYSSDVAKISDSTPTEESLRSRSGTELTNESTTISSAIVSYDETAGDDTIGDDTLDEETVTTMDTAEERAYKKKRRSRDDDGILSTVGAERVVRHVKDEVKGACEDTLSAFDQVFNAFTLQDKDIKAVVGRIDKAKRQFETGKLA